jgi:hypothetical protein
MRTWELRGAVMSSKKPQKIARPQVTAGNSVALPSKPLENQGFEAQEEEEVTSNIYLYIYRGLCLCLWGSYSLIGAMSQRSVTYLESSQPIDFAGFLR